MPSTQKQRPGHITTINHTFVLSGTLAGAVLYVTTWDVKEKEREKEGESGRISTDPLTRPLDRFLGPVISLIIPTLLSPSFITGYYRTSSCFYTKVENDGGPYSRDDVGAILRSHYCVR